MVEIDIHIRNPNPFQKPEPKAPQEYLEAIREAVRLRTNALVERFGGDKWSDKELDDYRDCNGWDGFWNDAYSADEAVAEDMTCWD